MKVTPDCVPCLMKRILFQARLLKNGCEFEAVKAALDAYSKSYVKGRNSAEVATEVHRAAYDVMKADPYLKMKIDADRIAGEFLDQVKEYIDSSEDRLAAAIRVAVIGNIMDFGVSIDGPEEFRSMFKDLLDQGIGSDDTEKLRALLEDAKSILYFFDNCGESQFDRFLIQEIQSMGVRVVGVVRGERILNDVTMEDAERIVKILTDRQPVSTKKREHVLLVGHGTETPATAIYSQLDYMFKANGHTNYHVGTIEGYPTFDTALRQIQQAKGRTVVLQPLMFVAGDHARNDISEDWKGQLENAGLKVELRIEGLGEIPEIQDIFIEHIRKMMQYRTRNISEKKKIYSKQKD